MKKWVILLLVLLLVACSGQPGSSRKVDNPSTTYDESVTPGEGQPSFPSFGESWVVDPDDACGFTQEYLDDANQVFNKLQQERYSEVVVVCQKGVQDKGPYNDEKIWTMDYGNYLRLGLKPEGRGLIWLIRPDVKPEEDRITLENSDWLFENTSMDYWDMLEEAANYANYDDFDGALESIARNTDSVLRKIVDPTFKP